MQYLHVKKIEKYLPGYKDRILRWFKVYFSDSTDEKTKVIYQSIFTDSTIDGLDEINFSRFIRLIAAEALLKRPVPLSKKYLEMMGWNTKKCSISITINLLRGLVDLVGQPSNVECRLKSKEYRVKSKECRVKNEEYKPEFLVFWDKYPERWIKSSDTKVKVGKDLAAEQWDKLSQSEQQYILRVVGRLRVGESVPDAWRWLRDHKWKDYELPKPKPVPLPKEQAKASARSKEIKNFVPGQSPFAQYKEMPLDKLIEKYKTSNEFERRIIKECRPEIKDRISPQKDIQNEAQQQIKKLGVKP